MRPCDRHCSARRRRRPSVEGLEGRLLLSYAALFAGQNLRAATAHALFVTPQAGTGIPGGSGGSGTAGATATAQPTPRELRRERFVARFTGSYFTGQGRYTDQAFQIAMLATGGSNTSFYLNLQLIFFYPTDPTQPVVGYAELTPKNVSSSGNAIGMDLTANAQQPGYHGLPTEFTWSVNGPNAVNASSGGAFSNATGQGTLQVRYYPNGQGPLHGFGQGTVALSFQGLINTLGVTNILAAPGNENRSNL
jgi:hypothetical protein